ncbi:ABC-2 type transporter, NodJ family [Desulfatibacillum alkenivorans DSM 16219]|jgi:Nod factor-specific ABC transporter NodJ protein|uniref:Transport permease protein n=1 Tax=Desulfatibacillum alkenivorans DSM 16219 TaxID=1121393 RepID=A0A1M6JVB8_9BACT|nr:ABC transporter permease [Desulfatibacillum alkenivorans]SHJ50619.1 ABC-2 type transporter, NodJ family [Desulfatibacillum alkenivorans DSM 16219]
MNGSFAVYYREMVILKRKIFKQIASMAVSPLLYLAAFGFAMGRDFDMDGMTYMQFLVPGLVAMASMTQAFSIASEINISRFYWHIFEEFQSAPLANVQYVIGEVAAAITRALLAVSVIMVLALCFGVTLSINLYFVGAIVINAALFGSVAVICAMLVKSHADQSLVTSFIITPMAFLGGTFFPLDRMPGAVQAILKLLPLTHAAKAIRTSAHGGVPPLFSYALLLVLFGVFFSIAIICVNKARN